MDRLFLHRAIVRNRCVIRCSRQVFWLRDPCCILSSQFPSDICKIQLLHYSGVTVWDFHSAFLFFQNGHLRHLISTTIVAFGWPFVNGYSRHLPQRRKFFCYRGEMEKLCDRLHRKVFCANMNADYLVLLSAESDQNNERYGVYARWVYPWLELTLTGHP